jgi:hypothetical protein
MGSQWGEGSPYHDKGEKPRFKQWIESALMTAKAATA